MQFIVRTVVGFCLMFAFCPIFVGCGDGSSRTTYVTNNYESPEVPFNPGPSDPVGTNPSYKTPCDPTTTTVAPIATPLVLRHEPGLDWLNPSNPIRNTTNSELCGLMKMTALQDQLSIRRMVVSSSVDFISMQVMVYNAVGGRTTFGYAPLPGRRFVLEATSAVEIGFLTLAGDQASIQLMTNTSQLDGQDVTFTIESIDYSVGNGPQQTITTGLPQPQTIRYREFPNLTVTAVAPYREAIASANTVVEEVELFNPSLTHTVTVATVNMLYQSLSGCGNFRLSVGNTAIATPLFPVAGFLEFKPGTTLVLAPGQRLTYTVLADTTQATGTLKLTANSVEQLGDNGTRNDPGGPRDENNWNFAEFVTNFVAQDADLQAIQSVLPPYNGDTANVLLMKVVVINNGTATRTVRGLYGRVIASNDLGDFYAWVVNTATGLSPDTILTRMNRLMRFDLDSNIVLAPGAAATVEVRINAGGNIPVGTSVQFRLEGLSTDQTLNMSVVQGGPSALLN